MCTKALRALTTNGDEVVSFALHQIAHSYDPETGMVQGAYPCTSTDHRLTMPTFHLAFFALPH
jgi:hypothetical protein